MNGPGLSLLQGGDSLNVLNNCLEREDEEEELKDERRRNEEVGDNYFNQINIGNLYFDKFSDI